ncbi:MAG: isoleucine--tRNA ligase [Alphaproteobacteria bacterium]|nr:isoleucine--tRNA ligase [Alphaproteobacteria bacterium]
MSTDYKETVFLPKTEFPMRGKLPEREPEQLKRWAEMDLFGELRKQSKGRKKFILHDGPPYANGHLHFGHALNKILKDVINRSQQMLGMDAHYVPGWDCHGLPIEWKIEERYRAEGRNKDDVPVVEFRRECREFAEKWVAIQNEEFQRLGILGDWDRPYTTMAFSAEAQIVREIGKFLLDGSLYRGSRPVLWAVPERTALADAEVEYHDHVSTTVNVRFDVSKTGHKDLEGASVVIWTTTPWTLPGNRALAFGSEIDYAVIEVRDPGEGQAVKGQRLLVAEALVAKVAAAAGIVDYAFSSRLKGKSLAGTVCRHPLHKQGYDFDVPMFAADFVTEEEGTGIVHIAPGHGADDWHLGMANGIEVPFTVGEDGAFFEDVPLFGGKVVYDDDGKEGDANGAVITAVREAGALLSVAKLKHTYPHSWRSKSPLILRNTAQWFISMEKRDLRQIALKAIEETRFVPAGGQKRLHGMIANRPDWCISRQRAWGVPLPLFVHKETGEPLRDQEVIGRIADAFEKEGGDAWFTSKPERFLGEDYRAEDYIQETDVVEVWFDSGSTHAFVLEARPELKWPASLYLEGSDQHRGWFHSSLLVSCGTRGRAPYDAVLTHGFLLTEEGQKMSKSSGNAASPQEVVDRSGADILRLWVVGADYTEDLRIGPEILKQQVDIYRRLRNTLRYLLGALDGFSDAEKIEPAEMPELERWVLHRLVELDEKLRQACHDFEFHGFFTALHHFCAADLSAFYFDIRKDALYCDGFDAPKRRAARTVLDTVFDCLTAWLAPFLSFTAEEAWNTRFGDDSGREASVHLRLFPKVPEAWRDEALARKWDKVRALRRVVTGAIEIERAEKRIGSSLQAAPAVTAPEALLEAVDGLDFAEICITSNISLAAGKDGDKPAKGAFTLEEVPGVAVVPAPAEGEKCARCWRFLPEVGANKAWPETCVRCADILQATSRPAAVHG